MGFPVRTKQETHPDIRRRARHQWENNLENLDFFARIVDDFFAQILIDPRIALTNSLMCSKYALKQINNCQWYNMLLILFCNSPKLYISLKYVLSVISVNLN